MDIQFYGANCITLTIKGARLVIDDNPVALGGKSIIKTGDIAVFTGTHDKVKAGAKLVVDMPGEYEVSNVSITGIPARAHLDESGFANTIYKIAAGDTVVAVIGHIHPELSDKQLEAIGLVDAMIVPVGGRGYTLDPLGALKVIKAVEPKVVIPSHYEASGVDYEVPQTDLKTALHDMGMEPSETVAKFKLKPAELSDATHLVVLEKS
jgi:L-ascorbate metabolism protein UlaG (beta-lactamase superfamily)